MADEEIRFGPGDHILFVLIPRTRSAEYNTPDGLDHYVARVALCVFDDPSVAGCIAALLNEDYNDAGPEDCPGGATTCAVLDLTAYGIFISPNLNRACFGECFR